MANTLNNIRHKHPAWIHPVRRIIPDIPIQINVLRHEPDRVGLEEPSEFRIVGAVPVIVEAHFSEVFAAGEEEPIAEE